ncbi:hypothetical protein LC040_01475 [Bacillus tianshenii]|nr:hypothetical protein LC040_01475 [Bacillus tianshenii]
MRQRIEVTRGFVDNQKVVLEIGETITEGINPISTVLVDSDNLAFVYLLDSDDGYRYVVLNEQLWPLLKEAVDHEMEVVLTDGTTILSLHDMGEEIGYLIDNIKGNSNYGEEMMTRVEEVFVD